MIVAAFTLVSVAALGFCVRLLVGPTVPDRVVALDGLLSSVTAGVLVGAAVEDSGISLSTVLVVAVVGFVGTGVLGRYIERRGE